MTATRDRVRTDLLAFLRTIERPEAPVERAEDQDNLIELGLIDSLALTEIITYLEETYGIDLAARGVDREELASIGGILDLVERRGE